MKFKVGSRVKVLRNIDDVSMDVFIGKMGTVLYVESGTTHPYKVEFYDGDISWWSNTELELVEDGFRVGDKVFIKSEKMKEHKEIYAQYKHLLGRVLTVKYICVSSGKYILEETEPFKKWTGIGIDGKYVDYVPMFDRCDLDKVTLGAYAVSSIDVCGISIHDMSTHYQPHPAIDRDKLTEDIIDYYKREVKNYKEIIRKNEEKYNDLVLRHELIKASLTNIRKIADKELIKGGLSSLD